MFTFQQVQEMLANARFEAVDGRCVEDAKTAVKIILGSKFLPKTSYECKSIGEVRKNSLRELNSNQLAVIWLNAKILDEDGNENGYGAHPFIVLKHEPQLEGFSFFGDTRIISPVKDIEGRIMNSFTFHKNIDVWNIEAH